jgi:glucose/arabinose dehydrogenase
LARDRAWHRLSGRNDRSGDNRENRHGAAALLLGPGDRAAGLAFYTGNLFPQWKNSVFVGALRGRMLDRLTLSGKKVIAEEPLLVDQHARIRDVRMGSEGAVYVLTDNGKLLKLTPK